MAKPRKFEEVLAAGTTFDANLTKRDDGPAKRLGRALSKTEATALVAKHRATPGFQLIALDADGCVADVGTNLAFPPTKLEKALGNTIQPFGHTE